MAAAERGSFLWMMFAITQVFLSIKLVGEVEGWITTLFGGGAAAARAWCAALLHRHPRPRDQARLLPVRQLPAGSRADGGERALRPARGGQLPLV